MTWNPITRWHGESHSVGNLYVLVSDAPSDGDEESHDEEKLARLLVALTPELNEAWDRYLPRLHQAIAEAALEHVNESGDI